MNLKVKERLHSQYLKSVSMLMSGTIIAQIMAFLASMFMTRLFSEESIGEYTLLLTAVSLFGAVICGRYDMSIVSEHSKHGTFALIKLCFILTTILSILFGLGYTSYVLFTQDIQINYISFLTWTIILLLLTGIGNIANAYNNKLKEYKLLSKVTILRESIRDITLIGTGLTKFGVLGLIISQVLSLMACLRMQFRRLFSHYDEIVNISWNQVIHSAKENKNQLLYSVPSLFVNNFSYSILNLFIGSMFGIKALAFYSMSYRVLGLPLALLSTNVSRVFYERAATDYNNGKSFTGIYLKSAFLLSLLGLPIMIVLIIFSPSLFGLLYGKEWEISGEIVAYLVPMFFVRLIVGALSPTMIIVNKQRIDMLMQLLFIGCISVSRLFSNETNDIFIFLKYITISFSLVYILYFIIMLKYSKINHSHTNK